MKKFKSKKKNPKKSINDFKVEISRKNKVTKTSIIQNLYGKTQLSQSKRTNKQYLIKTIEKNEIKKKNLKKMIKKELKIQKLIKHKNILKIKYFFENQKNVYITFENAKNGSLFNYLKKNTISENILKKIFFEITNLLYLLSKLNIIHGNLNLHNVLLDENLSIKLTNFGFYEIFEKNQEKKINFFLVQKMLKKNNDFLSPEILNGNFFSKKSDVFGLGVILLKLLNNCFFENNLELDFNNIINFKSFFYDVFENDLFLFLSGVLENDFKKRFGFEEIYQNEFFKNRISFLDFRDDSNFMVKDEISRIGETIYLEDNNKSNEKKDHNIYYEFKNEVKLKKNLLCKNEFLLNKKSKSQNKKIYYKNFDFDKIKIMNLLSKKELLNSTFEKKNVIYSKNEILFGKNNNSKNQILFKKNDNLNYQLTKKKILNKNKTAKLEKTNTLEEILKLQKKTIETKNIMKEKQKLIDFILYKKKYKENIKKKNKNIKKKEFKIEKLNLQKNEKKKTFTNQKTNFGEIIISENYSNFRLETENSEKTLEIKKKKYEKNFGERMILKKSKSDFNYKKSIYLKSCLEKNKNKQNKKNRKNTFLGNFWESIKSRTKYFCF